jgi:hypothetical protein
VEEEVRHDRVQWELLQPDRSFQEMVSQRLSQLEARQSEAVTPERIEHAVTEALRGVEAARLMELGRGGLRGQDGSFKDIVKRLDDLDFDVAHAGLLFKVGTCPVGWWSRCCRGEHRARVIPSEHGRNIPLHGGHMIIPVAEFCLMTKPPLSFIRQVLQEVVCDALGALESDILSQVGKWADDDQRHRDVIGQRLAGVEGALMGERKRVDAIQLLCDRGSVVTPDKVQVRARLRERGPPFLRDDGLSHGGINRSVRSNKVAVVVCWFDTCRDDLIIRH